jgi:hypothetical protein
LKQVSNESGNRIRIDLKRLPKWLQYVIAITVTAIVVAVAWHQQRPAPDWVMVWVVPILSWIGLVLIVTGVTWHLRQWWRRR